MQYKGVGATRAAISSAVTILLAHPAPTSAAAPQAAFTLAPRESRAFDDMVATAFDAPSSAGAVELTSAGTSVRVTSRLYSTAPVPTVGMFVPGLRAS